jgi:hypothetical protein
MKKILILFVLPGLLGFHADRDLRLTWRETESASKFILKHGIPVYGKAFVDYKQNNKSILKVKLDEPVIVTVAEKPEKWGHFQFPAITRTRDNLLIASWSISDDAVASYGKESGFKISSDGGRSWNNAESRPISGGIILPGGDRITIHTPPALKEEDVHLPQPVRLEKESYGGKFKFFRINELPDKLQGVYINRVKQGESKWTQEHAALIDSQVVRYSVSGLLPVVWWGDLRLARDSSVIVGTYPVFYENKEGLVGPSGVSFYRSTDKGHSWKIQGRVPYLPNEFIDKNSGKRIVMGFTEPGFEILMNGTYLCVMRTSDGYGNSPMYITRSADEGNTWSRPEPFTAAGVLPRLLQLQNGVIVLASGRPGVQLRFSVDGKGERWTEPFEMLPFGNEKDQVSCGYTELLATGHDRFLLIYSDFKQINQNNEIRKAIKIREIRVTHK